MKAVLLRIFDPLWDRPQRLLIYALATIYFARLTIWYSIEETWGKP